ncbi:BTAD domain-containing putative transcriptional regulator [Streptomyces sp. NPDC088116]|uniref:AfsR/SARP family transcriptional regulator n=1 Tax=Streptomyces sp. NPDC088116 TaxID=3365825 RepID=UPI003808F8E0
MKFQILGSMGTVVDGRVKALEGTRQRTLLALMLINPQKVVTKEQFFEEVWGNKLPSSPGNALQAVVARVRKALAVEFGEQFARQRLVTHTNGYAMDVDPCDIDAHLFGQLGAEAAIMARADQTAARDLLDRALELWRGPALQGVTGGLICESAAAQFEEDRLAAVEARVQLNIAVAGYSSVISELKKVAFLHPWRERLFELLMICLYKVGRQAEAVQAYNYLRRRLVEDFGMEPSPNLRKCMLAILHQDPSLGSVERTVVGRQPFPAPSSLPALAF